MHAITSSCVLNVQDIMENAIMKYQVNKTSLTPTIPGAHLQAFPYPCHVVDQFNDAMVMNIGLIWMVAFVNTPANLVRFLVEEKELRLKETMKVMGLSNAVFWVAAFLDTVACNLAGISLMVAVLKVGQSSITHIEALKGT